MSKKLGIIKSEKFFLHKFNENKFERPERLNEIYKHIISEEKDYIFIEPEEIPEETLNLAHSKFYTEQIKEYSDNKNYFSYDKDTYINEYTYKIARLAAGGCIKLADAIMNEEFDRGFAIVRPPGHHAEVGRAMGFCIFNNIALTALHLVKKYNLKRVLIIDFDAHHGNGTQEILYENNKILKVSIHENDIFPNSGKTTETGSENGTGYNINIPVHAYFGDEEYSYIFGKIIQPIVENYLPQIILVAAGFDGHKDDTSSKLNLTELGFSNITNFLTFLADKYSDGKLLYILEGGYNIDSLTSSLAATIEALKHSLQKPPGFMYSPRAAKIIEKELTDEIKQKWGIF